MNKLKNFIESFNRRLDKAEKRICQLEDRSFEITQWDQEKKEWKSKLSLQGLQDTIKPAKAYIMSQWGR